MTRCYADPCAESSGGCKGHCRASCCVLAQRLRTERAIGEMLAATVRHQGGRPKKHYSDGSVSIPPGVSWNQSAKWQKIAQIEPEDFEAWIAGHYSRWALVEGYHALGERIVTDPQYVKYEQNTLRSNLLSALTKDSNISVRAVYYAIQFYEKYPRHHLTERLQ
jgi:hypothetical protein